MAKVTVCMNCPKKGCGAYHDQCEAYQKEKEENNRIANMLRHDNFVDSYVTAKTEEARTRRYFRGRR